MPKAPRTRRQVRRAPTANGRTQPISQEPAGSRSASNTPKADADRRPNARPVSLRWRSIASWFASWALLVGFLVASALFLATAIGKPTTPHDTVPTQSNPGSIYPIVDTSAFANSPDGAPAPDSTIGAIASALGGGVYMAIDRPGVNAVSQIWYDDGRTGIARRLYLSEPVGRINAIESISTEPNKRDYANDVILATVAADRALVLGTSTGVYFASVELPIGSGARGSLTLSEASLQQSGADAIAPVSDLAIGASETIYLTGPEGPNSVSSMLMATQSGIAQPSFFTTTILPAIGIAGSTTGGQAILSSGSPIAISDVIRIAADHAGDLVVADQGGRRIVRIEGESTSVLYSLPEGETVRDLAFDEIGNLYWSSISGVDRMDTAGAVERVVGSSSIGQDEKSIAYKVAAPEHVVVGPDGRLLVSQASGLSVFSVSSVANLESTATRSLDLKAWVQGTPLRIQVAHYCACQSVIEDRDFFKIKIGIESSGSSAAVNLSSSEFFLIGLVPDAPTLEYAIPRTPDSSEQSILEEWSGRTLAVTTDRETISLDPLTTLNLNGKKYGVYAFKANPLNVVVESADSTGISFASELSGSTLAPGSHYYDERRGYGSLVFDAPTTSASGAKVRVLPLGIGYWQGKWRGISEITEWGAPSVPWNF